MQDVVKCSDIMNATQCVPYFFSSLGLNCILILPDDPVCREIVNSCEKINESKIACEFEGVAFDEEKGSLKCEWVNEKCILKV
jgi:hypothetical protein